jgi:hypothetical protein
VAAASSLVAGAGIVYFTDPEALTSAQALAVVLSVLVSSTAVYRSFWKPVGIRVIESATSPGDDTIEEELAIANGGLDEEEVLDTSVSGPEVQQ